MAFLLPKRVKDLPPLEPDSEDDKTPAKSTKFCLPKEKSMVDKFNNLPFQPIRVSELPPLSDSEPDENDSSKTDGFNCAILNESFIMSPSKCDFTPQKYHHHNTKENNQNYLNEPGKEVNPKDIGGSSIPFDMSGLNVMDENINQLSALNGNEKTKVILCPETPQNENISSSVQVQPLRKRQPFSFLNKAKTSLLDGHENLFFGLPVRPTNPSNGLLIKTNSDNIASSTKRITPPKSHDSVDTEDRLRLPLIRPTKTLPKNGGHPQGEIESSTKITSPSNIEIKRSSSALCTSEKRPQSSLNLKVIELNVDTPFKTVDINFATPQVKPFNILSVSRRPLLLGSNQHQTRTAIENEFRSQKILFQTPYAVSRPTVATMANDSLSLSLNDTPLSDSKQIITKPINYKKSSTELFKSTNKEQSNNNEQQVDDCDRLDIKNKQKEKTVLINYKEYVMVKKIGSGGSSSVYLAYRQDTKQECALKIVDLRGDRNVVEGYLNETRLLAKLQGNINVVTLFEYEHLKKESTLYMVMEKGDTDLHKILQSYTSVMPLYELMKIWYQMLQSVLYIHQNGIIHSDLKPANFLMVNGRLKLIDFGIASNIAIDSTSIIKFSQAGTFNYISPEALIDTSTGNSPSGKNKPKIKISTKSDVWSLGCIFYLLMYRKTPFGHIKNIYAKVNLISSPDTVIDYPKLPNYYPPMLIEMTKKCLVHNPKQRLSVAELLKFPFGMIISLDENQ